ncbi:Ppx/GppA phosphatase [Psychromonas ingrahamii 37]|uniref:Exopolyphosphatase n=1 Tax=Psychromonas ingrahamii (strain DSM 17664 / CCUG 51855 / 37) TaxID=357804 RepID=A1SXD0_PSYIN|nr:exopolyphosphatase [Psychromonas ingrahamii]ABM04145.1 Ppx/GppA phosphatase [Psychromonas ingrahamii 37]
MSQSVEQKVRNIAAIDLGSNSFHMVVAKVVGQDLQMVSRHKQRVRLASGLDSEMNLSDAAIERGLLCLVMFAERLQGFEGDNVRIVATHALRQANNAPVFIQRAREVLPFPIEIISGEEEARLIYLGVAHTQVESDSKLVVDIGGGSTEMIIGQGFEVDLLNSQQMGCVSFTNQFFNNGKLSKNNFAKATLAAEQRLKPLVKQYRKKGWSTAFGSSGTIKAIKEVLIGFGYHDGLITHKRLQELIDALCTFDSIDAIELSGLSKERKPVFAAGVVILNALFQAFQIIEMHFSDGALREGVLYEMEARFARSDIRMRTTENLANKHNVELNHAVCVKHQATELFSQIRQTLGIKKHSELLSLLQWAALLHEVGLNISLPGFHRHSAYILQHTNMPGFNSEQQLVLATLARFQCKSLKLNEMPEFNLFDKNHLLALIKILRLAIILNGQRNDQLLPEILLTVEGKLWVLDCVNQLWLEDNKSLYADLLAEQERWLSAGWQLKF